MSTAITTGVALGMVEPDGGDVNRAVTGNLIAWSFCGIGIVVVALRFWSRMIVSMVGADDWCMLAGLINMIVYNSWAVSYGAHLGGFRHLYYLTIPQTLALLKLNYIGQALIVFTFPLTKASVGFMVLRILGTNNGRIWPWRNWLIYATIVFVTVISIINMVLTFAQCDPPEALWNPAIPHNCWDTKITADFAIFDGSMMVLADVILALVPASIILKLKMDRKRRVNLSILLGLGLITAICGIVKTTFLSNIVNQTDLTWATYDILNWTSAELFLTILLGSIPAIKPLYDRYIIKGPASSAYNSSSSATNSTARSEGEKRNELKRERATSLGGKVGQKFGSRWGKGGGIEGDFESLKSEGERVRERERERQEGERDVELGELGELGDLGDEGLGKGWIQKETTISVLSEREPHAY